MINANELRIGNIIRANGPIMVVRSITEYSAELYMPGSEADFWDEDLENCYPIPLTLDILEKCGIKRHKCGISGADMWQGMDGYSYGDSEWIFRGTKRRDGTVVLKISGFRNSNIEYLHQLQNALPLLIDGEELNYTP